MSVIFLFTIKKFLNKLLAIPCAWSMNIFSYQISRYCIVFILNENRIRLYYIRHPMKEGPKKIISDSCF